MYVSLKFFLSAVNSFPLQISQALCEAAVPLVSEASEKAAKTSDKKGGDADVTGAFGGGWIGVLDTLRRLESAAIGSLAVAYFKVWVCVSYSRVQHHVYEHA